MKPSKFTPKLQTKIIRIHDDTYQELIKRSSGYNDTLDNIIKRLIKGDE